MSKKEESEEGYREEEEYGDEAVQETVEEVVEEKPDISVEVFVKYRVNYGRKTKTAYSESFIYRVHPKGFFLIDVTKTIEKLKVAAKFLARMKPERVFICSAREYAEKAILKMCEITGMIPKVGRFLPGTLTNYLLDEHKEIDLLFVVDHNYDSQAVSEAAKMKIPIVTFVDTNSYPQYVDLAIPANNKGRSSLAVLFWSLTILYLRAKGLLGEDEIIDVPIEDFMVTLE